jgi:hypothetical protein
MNFRLLIGTIVPDTSNREIQKMYFSAIWNLAVVDGSAGDLPGPTWGSRGELP